jgi:hypothetical protein
MKDIVMMEETNFKFSNILCFFTIPSRILKLANFYSQNWVFDSKRQLENDKLGCDSRLSKTAHLNEHIKILPPKFFSILHARFDRQESEK